MFALECCWQTFGAAPILFVFNRTMSPHLSAIQGDYRAEMNCSIRTKHGKPHTHKQNNDQTLHINMKSELIYQLTNNRPPLLPCFPKHRWCRPKTGRKILSVGIACCPKLWMKLSKHHTLRETGLSFRTKKLRLRRSLQDLQRAKKNWKSPLQCSDRSVQPPPVLSPSRTYIGASGLLESALIGNPYQSAVILYGFSWCC